MTEGLRVRVQSSASSLKNVIQLRSILEHWYGPVATETTLLFEGAWSFYSEHAFFVPLVSVVDFVAMKVMWLWQQRNASITVLPDGLRSCFSVTSLD